MFRVLFPRVRRRQILLELIIITLGLLIALGIDNLVEWRSHQALVAQARALLRAEIAENARRVDEKVAQIAKERKRMKSNIAALAPFLQKDYRPQDDDLSLGGSILQFDLLDTAWKTAQTTGALAYMPYQEARRYNEIYGAQVRTQTSQRAIAEDAALFFGLAQRFNLPAGTDLSTEEAGLLADRFGVWEVHLFSLDTDARALAELQHAFLENRAAKPPPNEGMSYGAG